MVYTCMLLCQLPYSHDIRVYSFNGGHPGTAYTPHALRNMPSRVKGIMGSHVRRVAPARLCNTAHVRAN